jgi:hypothetical protein
MLMQEDLLTKGSAEGKGTISSRPFCSHRSAACARVFGGEPSKIGTFWYAAIDPVRIGVELLCGRNVGSSCSATLPQFG